MLLTDLLSGLLEETQASLEGVATGVVADTRRIVPGQVFVALKGEHSDAHDLLGEAIARGAVAVVVDRAWRDAHPEPLGAPTFPVAEPRRVLAQLAARFHGEPSHHLSVVGVTGTNGKTTTTHMIEAILQAAGRTTGLIGTLGSRFAGGVVETGHTTPMAPELQALFARMRASGVSRVVMEVSSHALDQHRVGATEFAVGVFTNLTVDHLDYHHTMEAYGDAKARLFESLAPTGRAVINMDDPAWERMARASAAPVWTTSTSDARADLHARDLDLHAGGSSWVLVTPVGERPIRLRMPGLFNVSNALAAAGSALALGVDLETIASGLGGLGGVSGRVEVVSEPDCPFSVLVDYAHTPDGLENVLSTVRGFARARVIVVFGCGGDRDVSKRPQMGEVASRLAEGVYLTSDNPRSEDPMAIAEGVIGGIAGPYTLELDRAAAIRAAIQAARPQDVVVIAGKGHETYQIVGDQVLAFDDRVVAREAINARRVAP